MQILIFGTSCVGKTTIGKFLSEKLNYKFFDLDAEICAEYGTTNQGFIDSFQSLEERDFLRSKKVTQILSNNNNAVIAITPISCFNFFQKIILNKNVFCIELADTVDNIFDRLIFTDDYDNIMPDSFEYKYEHQEHYMEEIASDYHYYHNNYKQFDNEFNIDGMTPEQAADNIIKKYKLKKCKVQ